MNIIFQVFGTPQPQGSARAFVPKGWNRAVITTDNTRLKPWRQDVSVKAVEAMAGAPPTAAPVEVKVVFYFARPKSLKKSVTQKTTKPDLDKLIRGVLDALSRIVFDDDAQVVACSASKHFGGPEGAVIQVAEVAG